MVSVICKGLEWQFQKIESTPNAIYVAHQYAQLQARITRKTGPQVRSEPNAEFQLIHKIKCNRKPNGGLHMVFSVRGVEENFEMEISPNALRQWLEVIKTNCVKADWNLEVWPAWIH